jgi:hypothetical protein
MPDREDLIQALAQLDPATLEEVVNTAYRQRNDSAEAAAQARPGPHATPEQFARWLAQLHLSSDAAIERVVYLPAGAPDNEIRLLEVNRFLNLSDTEAIEPLDFSPETDVPYRVFVADITSDQWERVQREPDAMLPPGWRLDDKQVIVRG